jgi:hypothetical protein
MQHSEDVHPFATGSAVDRQTSPEVLRLERNTQRAFLRIPTGLLTIAFCLPLSL